ncbi:ribonuclease H-like domain-containing protein [Tanacetum coccineum]
MEAGTTSTTLTARLPILNPGEYDLWLMRIEQYFLMTDYSLWEVILNGNKVLKRTVGETEQEYEPTTTEEKQDRRNEMKARGTLLMALPNKDQLKFHSYKDAKLLMEAIEKRYGGNKESKKVQRTLLKQQYENFAGSSSETMDQTFDRLQKLISQLEIQGEVITQEDINLKLLRSLPSEWKTHALIWRNKEEIETISLDDFNSSTNEADSTAYGVSAAHTQCNPTLGDNLSDAMIYAFLASQPNSHQLAREDLEQIDPDHLEEMDLQWEMAMLTIRARRFIQRTGWKLDVNGQRVGFDRSKVECYNCHKNCHFARECRAPRNQENRQRENNRTVIVETLTENALVAQDGIGGYDWSYQAEEEHPTNFVLMANTSSGSSSSSDSEVDSCSKSCVKAYATLKEQYDSLSSDYKRSQFNLVSYKAESQVIDKFKTGLGYNAASSTAASPAVESFVNSSKMLENQENNKSRSDKGYHTVPLPFTGNFIPFKPGLTFMDEIFETENIDVIIVVTPSNVKKIKSNHESVDVKNNSDAVEPKTVRKNSFSPPIIEDWNSDDESEVEFIPNVKDKTVRPSTEKIKLVKSAKETIEKVIRPVWNNSSRVNHKNFANKITHPHPKRRFVPQAVLTKSGKLKTAGTEVNDVRPVNTVDSKPTVNHPRGNPQQKEYKEKAVIDSGCSTHMIGNKCYLDEYEDYDGGFVSFGDGKGRISGKELTCLFAKATIDESNLWHMRLGHINFKNINKLVKGNLNGIAERKNKTLIEAGRTMLVDSKLPTTFWAEAVNTACYVLNMVLVVKPHTKTPYELIRGRTLLIDFMKPFGCPVTILNTRDHLGKFDGKANEGFFVGYSVVSKAINGPDWLFDVDSLTNSINYVLVVARNQTNGIAGTRDNIVAGPKDSEEDAGMKPIKVDESGALDKGGKDEQATISEFERLLQQEKHIEHINRTNSFNTVSTPVSAVGPSFTDDTRTSEEHLFE